MEFTFSKSERLSRKKIIGTLFSNGEVISEYPLKAIWLLHELDTQSPAQVLISVPGRNFRKSSERNYIKRLLREAYRKNKAGWYDYLRQNKKQCALAIIYNGKKIAPYFQVEAKIILILQRLQKDYEKPDK